jgi:hypothetical protein
MGDTGRLILQAIDFIRAISFGPQVQSYFDILDTVSDGNILGYLFHMTY